MLLLGAGLYRGPLGVEQLLRAQHIRSRSWHVSDCALFDLAGTRDHIQAARSAKSASITANGT
jgi:hypothetical protein